MRDVAQNGKNKTCVDQRQSSAVRAGIDRTPCAVRRRYLGCRAQHATQRAIQPDELHCLESVDVGERSAFVMAVACTGFQRLKDADRQPSALAKEEHDRPGGANEPMFLRGCVRVLYTQDTSYDLRLRHNQAGDKMCLTIKFGELVWQ